LFLSSKNCAVQPAPEVDAGAPERVPSAAELFQAYGAFVWRVLRRLGVADADVDDVVQEVFVAVHRRLPAFEGRSSPRTWVYGICVRVASDHRKRARVRRESLPDRLPEPAIDAHQEDDVALREARALLDRLLDGLDEGKRAVFVLYEIEELPMGEVALALGCPLQTAYSRLHAARRDLDAALRRLRASEALHG
jgi:RNA polymerase sigma-70 factor (ECF subfamily)